MIGEEELELARQGGPSERAALKRRLRSDAGDWYNPFTWFEDPKIKQARIDAKVQAIRDETSAKSTENFHSNFQKSTDAAWGRTLKNAQSNYQTLAK